jgi:hypothetical protein
MRLRDLAIEAVVDLFDRRDVARHCGQEQHLGHAPILAQLAQAPLLPFTFGDGDIFGRNTKRISHRLVFVLG